MFFFEKKNQKTSIRLGAAYPPRGTQPQTFFASFFQKRRPRFLADMNEEEQR